MIASRVSTVKRNMLANYPGQVWGAIMSMAFVSVYIHYIGASLAASPFPRSMVWSWWTK